MHLLTYHRAKGLEWDAVFLPALEEGVLPIRHAKEDDEIAEERRLLYVGITRARTHLALSWAARRTAATPVARRPTVSLPLVPPRGLGEATDGTGDEDGTERHLLEALQLWRRERARADGVPAYVVAHDATLVEIAADRPRTRTALERVKGMGPVKVERYADEILAAVARFPERP